MHLTLPWPPSVNHYWRVCKGRMCLSKAGKQYRTDCLAAVLSQIGKPTTASYAVTVEIAAYPPDRRVRDLDNLLKATLDALSYCGILQDDSQIDDLRIFRGHVSDNPHLDVRVGEFVPSGMAAIMGKWPGTESDEQVAQTLEELS